MHMHVSLDSSQSFAARLSSAACGDDEPATKSNASKKHSLLYGFMAACRLPSMLACPCCLPKLGRALALVQTMQPVGPHSTSTTPSCVALMCPAIRPALQSACLPPCRPVASPPR